MFAVPASRRYVTARLWCVSSRHRVRAALLKSRYGSAIASPSDYKDMVPVNGPGDDGATTDRIEPVEPRGSMVVDIPTTGEKLEIRAAQVAWGPWRGATVYCARLLGEADGQAASRDLRAAVAQASHARPRSPWVDDLARQLEHELVT